jgi:hypothetical protein
VPSNFSLTLPLFVAHVFADDVDIPVPTNNFAFNTQFFNRCTNFQNNPPLLYIVIPECLNPESRQTTEMLPFAHAIPANNVPG